MSNGLEIWDRFGNKRVSINTHISRFLTTYTLLRNNIPSTQYTGSVTIPELIGVDPERIWWTATRIPIGTIPFYNNPAFIYISGSTLSWEYGPYGSQSMGSMFVVIGTL